ncbi:MAG: Ada metal-binding domain-containing protein, partial [Acidobacteriaceae bacterium]
MNPTAMLTEDQAWDAVLARDPAADAELVYAVTTTGVFCRPTCPSRRPDRCNVVFFPDPATAVRAGYRPCRRCRPQQQHRDAALVETVSASLK